MTAPTTHDRIRDEISRLRDIGEDFSPVDVAVKLGLTSKQITAYLKSDSTVYRVRKAHARRFSETTLVASTEPEYYPSVWGFLLKKVPA